MRFPWLFQVSGGAPEVPRRPVESHPALVRAGRKLDLDAAEREELGRILMYILNRYALTDLVYANERGSRVPVRIKRWTSEEYRRRKLAEAVREWKSGQA